MSELYANENKSIVELEEIRLQIPKQTPPPPPVPVYTQISITIPCTSPQLDSLGSSPKSDYSSYSSSSGRQHSGNESAKEKIITDIRSLTPKLKNVNISDKQSPRINYMVNNEDTVETKEALGKPLTHSIKKVTSELFIPIYNHDVTYNYSYNSNSDSMGKEDVILTADVSTIPDNLMFANQTLIQNTQKINNINSNDASKDANSNKRRNSKPAICNVCNIEITR